MKPETQLDTKYTKIAGILIFTTLIVGLIVSLYRQADNLSIGAPTTSTTTVDSFRAQYEADLLTSQDDFYDINGRYDGKNIWDGTKYVLNNVDVHISQYVGPQGNGFEIMYVVEDQYNNKGSSTIDTWKKHVNYKRTNDIAVKQWETNWIQIGGI